nr:MAG TPA: hypothetical protein [Caudoviricetes sp.]
MLIVACVAVGKFPKVSISAAAVPKRQVKMKHHTSKNFEKVSETLKTIAPSGGGGWVNAENARSKSPA